MKFLSSFHLGIRLFAVLAALVVGAIAAFVLGRFFGVVMGLSVALGLMLILDTLLLYTKREGLWAQRQPLERMSNGDPNPITIFVQNHYPFEVQLQLVDELPHQFQKRDALFELTMASGQSKTIEYNLKPTQRGEYNFGRINVLVRTGLGLVLRRYRFGEPHDVAVYPSYIQLRKFDFLAISQQLGQIGVKKIRRLGHTLEFEQIKTYNIGDDYRSINWKASAKHARLMVNQHQDEKSQQVYCVIDTGRTMKMPFEGLSLLDYAINASLVLSHIAINRQDRAGLLTFDHKGVGLTPADKRSTQMQRIMDQLYRVKTDFMEPNFEILYTQCRKHITRRSLLILYTNFESLYALERQLPHLKRLSVHHLLLVVFFENTELHKKASTTAQNTNQIYEKVIAEQFMAEKKLIARELTNRGIQTILTPPAQLSINTINKYLELKARGLF